MALDFSVKDIIHKVTVKFVHPFLLDAKKPYNLRAVFQPELDLHGIAGKAEVYSISTSPKVIEERLLAGMELMYYLAADGYKITPPVQHEAPGGGRVRRRYNRLSYGCITGRERHGKEHEGDTRMGYEMVNVSEKEREEPYSTQQQIDYIRNDVTRARFERALETIRAMDDQVSIGPIKNYISVKVQGRVIACGRKVFLLRICIISLQWLGRVLLYPPVSFRSDCFMSCFLYKGR